MPRTDDEHILHEIDSAEKQRAALERSPKGSRQPDRVKRGDTHNCTLRATLTGSLCTLPRVAIQLARMADHDPVDEIGGRPRRFLPGRFVV
jgi:hypothetical protein